MRFLLAKLNEHYVLFVIYCDQPFFVVRQHLHYLISETARWILTQYHTKTLRVGPNVTCYNCPSW